MRRISRITLLVSERAMAFFCDGDIRIEMRWMSE